MLRGWDPTSKDVGVQDMFHHSGHANLKGLCCLWVHGDIWHRTLKRTMSGTMVLLQPISVLSVVQDLGLHLWPDWASRTIQIWAVWTDNWDHGILWTKQPGPWLGLWSCLSLVCVDIHGYCYYQWQWGDPPLTNFSPQERRSITLHGQNSRAGGMSVAEPAPRAGEPPYSLI